MRPTIHKVFVAFMAFFFFSSSIDAQVSKVDYLIKYDTSSCNYTACVIMATGTNSSIILTRAHANAQYSLVVPDGVGITIDTSIFPIAQATSMPVNWAITSTTFPPNSTTTNKYYSVTPELTTAYYDPFMIGDTIPLFKFSITPDNLCGANVRNWENNVDPSSAVLLDNNDYNNGFTLVFSSPPGAQLYRQNHMKINPPPTVEIDGECGGQVLIDLQSVADDCNGPYTFNWSGPNGFSLFSTDSDQDVLIDPATSAASGTYYVTITDNRNCMDTLEIPFEVQVGGVDPIDLDCYLSGTAILNGEGSGTWSLDAANSDGTVSFSNTSDPTATVSDFSTPGSYTILWTNGLGTCTDMVSITVNNNCTCPIMNNTIDDPTTLVYCENATVTISGSNPTPAGGTFLWNYSTDGTNYNPASGTNNQQSYDVNVGVGTHYFTRTYFNTVGNTCDETTSSVVITVNAAPTAGASASDDELCLGESTNLTGTGGISYVWNNGAGSGSIVTVSPAATTTYEVIVTDANGCTATAEVTVTVNPLPTVGLTALDDELCIGESTDLTATGGVSYEWEDGSTDNPRSVSPIATTTYEVIVTDANGCTATAEVTVTVNPLPTAGLTALDDELCIGESTDLTATGGVNYEWEDGSTDNPRSVSPIATTTYEVIVTDVNGCTATAEVTVTVNPLPTAGLTALDDELCIGESTDLTATGGVSYEWEDGSTDNPRSVSPIATTTYEVIVTDVNGCTATAEVTVTVNPLPTAGLTALDDELCIGESTDLTATGGVSYEWEDGSTDNPRSVSPIATTTYEVIVTDVNGCTATAEVTVTVNPLPTAGLTALDDELCIGESTDLTATGGVSYEWEDGSTDNPRSVSPIATTTYEVIVTDVNGCTATAEVTVTVNPLPTAGLTALDDELCIGESTDLTATGGVSYEWEDGSTDNPRSVSPIATTTYEVIVTDVNGCTATAEVTVTVNPLPTAGLTALDDELCIGESTDLTATGGVNYEWEDGSTDNPRSVSPIATTTYEVIVTDANGCTATAEVTVTVNPLPTAGLTALDDELCIGESTDLTATGGVNYEWEDGSTDNPRSVSPIATTTYEVIVTDVNGCTATAEVTVTVNPLPTAGLTALDDELCIGESTDLTATGGVSYEWEDGSTDNPRSVSPIATTTYEVIVTDANGCTATAEVTVTVNPLPTAGLTALDDELCIGESTDLTATGGVSYEWEDGSTDNPRSVSPIATTTYEVIVTDANGCTATAEVTVTVNPLPTAGLTALDDELCIGESTDLTATGGVSYEWEDGSTDNPRSVSPIATTTYEVIVTDANGCTATAEVTVTVNPLPTAGLTALDDELCIGESTDLTATGGVSYEWEDGSTDNPRSVSPIATTTYEVIVTDANGCTATAEVTVTVNPLPTVSAFANPTEICVGEAVELTGSGATSYNWDNSAGNGSSVFVSPTSTTTYTVIGTDGNGCESSATVDVIVKPVPLTPLVNNNGPLCEGEELELSTDFVANATYSWTFNSTEISTLQNPTISNVRLSDAGIYELIVTVDGCASPVGSTEIFINEIPATPIANNNGPLCEGDDVLLTTDFVVGATYSWSFGGSEFSTIQNPVITSASTFDSGEYSVVVTVNGCESQPGTTSIDVNPIPATPVANNDGPACQGETVTLSTDMVTNATYLWKKDGIDFSMDQNPTTTEAGEYTIEIIVDGCTSSPGITTVTFNEIPATPIVNNNGAVCVGEDVLLTTDFVVGATYSWSFGGSEFSTEQNPVLTAVDGTDAGVYELTVTVNDCTSPVGSTTVNITPNPALPTVSNNGPLCEGETITLTTDAVGEYNWTINGSFYSDQQNPTTTQAGVYSLVVTVDGCVSPAATTEAIFNAIPGQSEARNNGPICVGENLVLSTDFVADATYSWTFGGSEISTLQNPELIATLSDAGIYSLSITVNGCTSDLGTTDVQILSQPDAGTDIDAMCVNLVDPIILNGIGTAEWSTTALTGVNISDVNANNPSVTVDAAGVYTFIYDNGVCSDEVIVTVTEQANAGTSPDLVKCNEIGTAVISAISNGSGTWTLGATAGTAVIAEPTMASTSVSMFEFAGTYELIWTTDDGCTDAVTITVGDDCDCPIANNLIDQPTPDFYCETSPELEITGTDAVPSGGEYSWIYSTDGSTYSSATNSADASIYNTETLGVGVHYFRRIFTTTVAPICADTSNAVMITVMDQVSAGNDQEVSCAILTGGSIIMAATGEGSWTKVSGAGVTIVDAADANTEIKDFEEAGVYVFAYSNGACTDEVEVIVTEAADASGPSTIMCFAKDEAILTAEGSGVWTADTNVTFDDANTASAIATFMQAGNYTLTWTTTDGCTIDVVITVGDDCDCEIENNDVNQPNPSEFCGTSTDVLIDGETAIPANGIYLWEYSTDDTNYSATANTSSNEDYNTGVLAVGNHYFRRIFTTTVEPLCADTSESVLITVNEEVTAGNDQEVDCITIPGGSITMTATGLGTWSVNGPGTVNIIDENSPTTLVSDFAAPGMYTFMYGAGICLDEMIVTVSGEANAGEDQTVQCFINGTATVSAIGLGEWTLGTSDGNATIDDVTSANTTIDGFTTNGNYTLIWTADNGCSDEVIITVGDDCPCTITGNDIAQPVVSAYCDESPNIIIIGTEASPMPGNYQWQVSTDGGTNWSDNASTDATLETGVLTEGNYLYRRIYHSTGTPICSDTSNIIEIIVNEQPTAGIDQNLDCIDLGNGAITLAGSGSGTWTVVGPGTASIADANNSISTVSGFTAVGDYVFTFSTAFCSDEMTVSVTENSDAGFDQSDICFETASINISATPASGMWTISGPGTASIANANSATTSVTGFTVAGDYTLTWTSSDGCSDDMVISLDAVCNCEIDNNEITGPAILDYCDDQDGLVIIGSDATPTGGAYTWEYSFDGGTFAVATGTNDLRDYTTGTLSVGTHTFKRIYAVTSPIACETESNLITININEAANAGEDQSDICFETASINISATPVSGMWTISGPGTASIANANSATTSVTGFTVAGDYTLTWTSSDGCSDDMVISLDAVCNCEIDNNEITGPAILDYCDDQDGLVIIGSDATPTGGAYTWEYSFDGGTFAVATGANDLRDYRTGTLSVGTHTFKRIYAVTSPIACETESNLITININEAANAGEDQNDICFETANINISATPASGMWTISGPGTASIANANSATTSVTGFTVAGDYTLTWTSSDGCSDDMVISLDAVCNCSIEDNSITDPMVSFDCGQSTPVTIVGNDVLPTGGTYLWSYDDGNGFVDAPGVNNMKDYTTPILGIGIHFYKREYAVTGAVNCETESNIISITVSPASSAGQNQVFDCVEINGLEVTLTGSGSGTWSQISGPGADILNSTSESTVIRAFADYGLYTFAYGTQDCKDEVTVSISQKADAGSDQTVVCYSSDIANVTAVGQGTWSILSGTASINDSGSNTTMVSGFTSSGEVILRWTNTNGCTDDMIITVGDDCPCDILENSIADPSINQGCGQLMSQILVGNEALPAGGDYEWYYSEDDVNYIAALGVSNENDYTTPTLDVGTHFFKRRYTTDLCFTESNKVELTVSADADAGIDQTLTCVQLSGGSVTMQAVGTGVWTQSSSNPGQATILSSADNQTEISGFDASGEYTFTWSTGVCSDDIVITIEDKNISAGQDQNIDCFVNATATMNATGIGTWTWISSITANISDANDPSAVISEFEIAGVYELMWSDGACDETLIITVGEDCPCDIIGNNILDDLDDIYCQDAEILTITGDQPMPEGGTYLWLFSVDGVIYTNAPGINNKQNYNTKEFGSETNYFKRVYTVTDSPLCADTSNVVDFKSFNTKFTPGDIILSPSTVCNGDSLSMFIENYDSSLNYEWAIESGRGSTVMNQDSVVMIKTEGPGMLTVSVRQWSTICGKNMISEPTMVNVMINPLPQPYIGPDTIVCDFELETFELFAGDYDQILWQDGSETAYYDVSEKGTYKVLVVDSMGCVGSDQIKITSDCCEFAHPNILNVTSTNGNDEFVVNDRYGCAIESKIQIYDRWGNLMYISDDASIPWDGKYNGDFVEQGVYVFVFKYTAIDGNDQLYDGKVSGDITVLRTK